MAREIPDPEIEEEKNIKTVLEQDIKFSGNLKFSTSLKIKGGFEGEINSTGHLYIGKNASVKAKIKAKHITIYGKVEGNIEAIDKVEILSTGSLTGDVKAPDLLIQSGCIFNGKCIMNRDELNKEKPSADAL